jgi:hypothetical protein
MSQNFVIDQYHVGTILLKLMSATSSSSWPLTFGSPSRSHHPKMAEKSPSSILDSKCLPDNLQILNGVLCSNGNELQNLEWLENNNNRVIHRHRHLSLEDDDEAFVHVNAWHTNVGGNPCSKTETIYLFASRSEEPVVSNMDISTGHIVLVSYKNY